MKLGPKELIWSEATKDGYSLNPGILLVEEQLTEQDYNYMPQYNRLSLGVIRGVHPDSAYTIGEQIFFFLDEARSVRSALHFLRESAVYAKAHAVKEQS